MDKILVTGGAGSIGSAVAKRLSSDGYAVRVMDTNEEGLHSLSITNPEIEGRLLDVQFIEDAQEAMKGVSAVVHAAAYKHVTTCEKDEAPALRVNWGGAVRVCQQACGRRFVFVSTDKALKHTSIMGYTKAKAERGIMTYPNTAIVRFGNVLGSSGSLLPAILRYVAADKPIPITDPKMTRFFMLINEAVDMILAALWSKACKVYSPAELKSANIEQFINVCCDLYAAGHPVEIIGSRPGEKLHEIMEIDGVEYHSNDQTWLMTNDEIVAMLVEASKQ